MHKSKLEIAVSLAIDLLLAYYLLVLIHPHLKVYASNYLRMLRFNLYTLTTAKWLLEAKQVRGQI